MNIDIITPDQSVLSGEITSVKLPGSNGSFQVLDNHANLISSLEEGIVTVLTVSGETKSVNISGGVVEIIDNKITVLAESVITE